MKLDLRDLETFPARRRLETDAAGFDFAFDGIVGADYLSVELTIQKSGEEYFCQGKVRARVRVECARCLETFAQEIATPVDFIVCAKETHQTQSGDGADDEDYVFFEGGSTVADLTPLVRQAVVLEVPMMPLCSEECQGLCPKCGTNLNHGSCDCRDEAVDERWEALKGLSGDDPAKS